MTREFFIQFRACLKNHSYNLHALIYGIFCLHSVAVARYAAFIQKAFFKYALEEVGYIAAFFFYFIGKFDFWRIIERK